MAHGLFYTLTHQTPLTLRSARYDSTPMAQRDRVTIGAGAQEEFTWRTGAAVNSHAYVLPAFRSILTTLEGPVLDLGCGNGALTAALASRLSAPLVGIDASASGINHARMVHRGVTFEISDLSSSLPEALRGRFNTAISSEVIEHLLLPRELFNRATESGASTFVVSTPYHGYWKNLALAMTGQFDRHWNPLMDYGHIKFFSERTLTELGGDCGWTAVDCRRVGRVKPFAKSMVMTFCRR